MSIRFLLTILLLTFRSALAADSPDSTHTPLLRLTKAYAANTEEALRGFLDTWCEEVTPVWQPEQRPQPERDLYEIVRVFYNPPDSATHYSAHQIRETFRDGCYVTINTDIRYAVGEGSHVAEMTLNRELPGGEAYTTVSDLFPPIDNKNTHVLYLSGEFGSALMTFLNTVPFHELLVADHDLSAEERTARHKEVSTERKKRLRFLRNILPIRHGHWGGWYTATPPSLKYVVFNIDLTEAMVVHKNGPAGHQEEYRKTVNGWSYVGNLGGWIE